MNCKEELQHEMKENHHFLWKLYVENPQTIRRNLAKASNNEMCTLIKIIYCVEQGYIPIKKKNYYKLVATRRMKPILELKYHVKNLLRKPLVEKQKWAMKIASLYKFLLYSIFEE